MGILIPKSLEMISEVRMSRHILQMTERVFQCTLFAFDVLFRNQCTMSDSL